MDRLQQHIRIARLIFKEKFMGLSLEEQQELQQWRMLSPRNEQDYKSFDTFYGSLENSRRRLLPPEEEWSVFRKRLRRSRQLRWLQRGAIAASLCLLIGLSGVLLLQHSPERLPLKQETTGGVRLILPTGESLNLSSADQENLQKIADKALAGPEKLEYIRDAGKAEPEWNTLLIPKGAFYHLILSDGTRVWLNAGTKVIYPVPFAGVRREILLEGEAFFEVAKDPEHPFVVRTENFEVKVLGTSFNINTYGDDGKAYTALQEGVVEISSGEVGNTLIIAPGQVAELDVRQPGALLKISPMPVEQQLAWKEGFFCFRHTSLQEILKQVERYYDVEFVNIKEVEGEYYTGDISRNVPLTSILSAIRAQTTGMEFEISGRTVYIIKKRD